MRDHSAIVQTDQDTQCSKRRGKISDDEKRARKNDAPRLERYLKNGGAVTKDSPVWRRAAMTGRGFNSHVCERLLNRGDLVIVSGSMATYRFRSDLIDQD